MFETFNHKKHPQSKDSHEEQEADPIQILDDEVALSNPDEPADSNMINNDDKRNEIQISENYQNRRDLLARPDVEDSKLKRKKKTSRHRRTESITTFDALKIL